MESNDLLKAGASLVFPAGGSYCSTHLGIGAHADDLEIMAYHGIAECYESDVCVFSGITVTDGAGSPQREFEKLDREQLKAVRQSEQIAAAELGRYGFIAQLNYTSSEVKSAEYTDVVQDIFNLLQRSKPRVVYLHQPGDKHPTHLAVLRASIEALQMMKVEDRPEQVYGCEVWRDLDWLSDEKKIYLPTDAYPELAEEIISVFQSQIRAGVAYDKGALGRRLANGAFANPHIVREGDSFTLAIDLLPVVNGEVSLCEMVLQEIEAFKENVEQLWKGSLD